MPMPLRKRPRERPTADSEMFAIYEDLANEDESIRIKAATRLLKRLEKPESSAELEKVLKRLIRGLCSSRKAARLGFSIALTELLSQHVGQSAGHVTSARVIRLLKKLTEISAGTPGQESRDHHMGRVFGAEAIVQSGILFPEKPSEPEFEDLLETLLGLASKKPWIREECAYVCYLSVMKLQQRPYGKTWVEHLLQQVANCGLAKTPEGVALWVSAQRLFPGLVTPSGIFHGNDPLSIDNRKAVLRILKEETSRKDQDSEPNQTQRSTWSARPHFAWDIIFAAFTEPDDRAHFGRFWQEVVDEGLFSASSSSERKHWGMSLFAKMVTSVPLQHVECLLSQNLLKCLANQLAMKDRYLHLAAERCVKAILTRARSVPAVANSVLNILLNSTPKDSSVIAALKAKLLDKLVSLLDTGTLKELFTSFKAPLKLTKENGSVMNDDVVDVFVTIIRVRPYPDPSSNDLQTVREAYNSLLGLFVKVACFQLRLNSTQNAKPDRSNKVVDQLKARLNTCLSLLCSKDGDPSYYPREVLRAIELYEAEYGYYAPLDEQVQVTVQKARRNVQKLGEPEFATSKHAKAITLLYSLSIIQVYNGDPDALEVLEDLQTCYKSITRGTKGAEQAKAADAVLEVLLSFTSKPPTIFKTLAQQTFALCTDIITEQGLRSLLDVLRTREDVSGQNELFEQIDDEAGDKETDSDEDVNSGDASDVEMIDGGDQVSDDKSSASSADESGNEDESDDDEDDELMAFDAKLAQALGTRRADDDLAHGDSDSSESDMNDEQMEALDGHIAQLFKHRKEAENKSKKREQKDAKETIVIFKTRVLELLKIYIEQQHSNPLALNLIVPLARAIKDTRNKVVVEKAANVIRDFSRHVKLVKPPTRNGGTKDERLHVPDPEFVKKAKHLLKDVHDAAAEESSNQHHSACSQASLLLVKIVLNNGGELAEVEKRYAKTHERFLTEKACAIKTSFFTDWMNWSTAARQTLAE